MQNTITSTEEQFYYNISDDSYTVSGLIIHINPKSYWDKEKSLPEMYTDEQYDILYPMLQEIEVSELKECTYEPIDPTLTIEDLKWKLESIGFISNDDFDNYIED